MTGCMKKERQITEPKTVRSLSEVLAGLGTLDEDFGIIDDPAPRCGNPPARHPDLEPGPADHSADMGEPPPVKAEETKATTEKQVSATGGKRSLSGQVFSVQTSQSTSELAFDRTKASA